MTAKILYVHRGDRAEPPSFAAHLAAAGYATETRWVPYDARAKGLPAVFALADLDRYDAILASEYFLVWALALRLRVTGAKVPLLALGFNQSAQLIRTGRRTLDQLLNRIWRRVARFVVHSQSEARLFAAAHDIASEKFAFAHWGYDLPKFHRGAFTPPATPFVSMIGRNNRDIATFFDAVTRADIDAVLVTSSYMMTPALAAATPPRVRVLLDVPMGLCLDIVSQSMAHLILVNDDRRGAGHISAVSAMLLEKPQIFSAVDTLDDYLIDGVNAIGVPMHDAAAVAAAIAVLRDDRHRAAKLGRNGQAFARRWLSNDHAAQRIADLILAALGKRAEPRDDWPTARAEMKQANPA